MSVKRCWLLKVYIPRMQIDLTQKAQESQPDVGLEYSKRILEILRKKVKEANASSDKKVTLNQLKAAFVEGHQSERGNPIIDGFSRVNMFVRLYCSDSMVKEFFAQSKARVVKSTFDLSSHISPNEQDILQGVEDGKGFTGPSVTIEELYLDNPNIISAYHEYL